jgi:outer membrane lipopolysaccharide assembly protein LptE/RlpB|tara:strand:+ start:5859 stop:6329 length:471 start_codon:yes stop_codon:yes gene_type:complete
MIKKKILLLIFFIIVAACNYEPLYSKKNINFSITKIEFKDESKITSLLKNNLDNYINKENKENNYNLNIETTKNITTTSKDEKGNPKSYSMEIMIKAKIVNNNKQIKEKNFKETFNYSTEENKFNLSQYEKDIEETLINKVSKNLILYLTKLTNDS